jgi:hypothetical protein
MENDENDENDTSTKARQERTKVGPGKGKAE